MSEKRYEVQLPKDMLCSTPTMADMTEAEIDLLMGRLQAAKKKAEADTPKAWDFGIDNDDLGNPCLHIKGESAWSFRMDPTRTRPDSRIMDTDVHILGNLKEIVEQQGPIVVGLSVAEARAIEQAYRCSSSYPGIQGKVCDALARFERNKP